MEEPEDAEAFAVFFLSAVLACVDPLVEVSGLIVEGEAIYMSSNEEFKALELSSESVPVIGNAAVGL